MSFFIWIAYVPLLFSIRNCTPGEAFRSGIVAAIVHYSTLAYWLVPTITEFGFLPVYVSLSILLLVSAACGIYIGIASYITNRTANKPNLLTIVFPLALVSTEYLRASLFTGLPWELTGHSLYKNLYLIQIADITGVYGLSFLIAFSNAAIFVLALKISGLKWKNIEIQTANAFIAVVTAIVLISACAAYGAIRMKNLGKVFETAETTKISVVQGNIKQKNKWNPAFRDLTVLKYINLSLSTATRKPDLIVWPETSTPFFFNHNMSLSNMVRDCARDADTFLLFGSPSYERKERSVDYFNSAILLNNEGNEAGVYNKVHLIPFGEYVPLKKWIPFLGKIVPQISDFKPGVEGTTLKYNNFKAGVQICGEILFPELARQMAKKGAAVLVNITNDAWFFKSSQPFQHFSMIVFRAVEIRRPVVRAANTGISGFISPNGEIIAQTALFEDEARTAELPITQIQTFYLKFGDVFATACLFLTSCFVIWTLFIKNKKIYNIIKRG